MTMTPPYNEPSASAFLDTGLLQRAGRFALGEADPVAPHATARAEIGRSPQRLGLILRWGTLAADAAIAFGAIVYSGFSGPSVALPILTLVWLLLLRGCGAYRRGLGYSLVTEARSVSFAGLLGALLLLQLGPAFHLVPLRAQPLALVAPIVAFTTVRMILRGVGATLRHRRALVRRMLLVGDGADAHELLDNIDAWPGLGIEIVGVCADTTTDTIRGLPVLGLSRSCGVVAATLGLKTVLLAPAALRAEDVQKLHSDLLHSELEVVLVPNVAHVEAARLSARQLGGLPVLRLAQREDRARQLGKRTFDLVVSALLLVLLTPFLVAVALMIKLDSPGPAFFRQVRVGRDGEEFELWKFRTMRFDAESMLDNLREAVGRASGLFKLPDDPRVTKVGRWLRRSSLDELPQLWNVLIGEMSLVGPRPALPHEVARFDDFTLRRLRVKPGITGLWQVSGRSDATFATYSRMDTFYAENWTLAGDVRILLRTIPVVLGSRGAY